MIYGVNTGFGYLQNVRIDSAQLEELQKNLLQSHACGMGEEVPDSIVKLMIMLKIKSLCYGHSGVQIETVKRLTEMYNQNVLPIIYSQGSLGASGDLAPLSHLCLPLIGMGEVHYDGKRMASAEAFKKLGWNPIKLQSKEGLALINGTQFMSAYGLYILMHAEKMMKWANVISAISYDAFGCRIDPLHPAIHAVRPHRGQVKVAAQLSNYLNGSELLSQPKTQVQDPYSFRCIPQVHGASSTPFIFISR
jgi:histidine ammonia-lyase